MEYVFSAVAGVLVIVGMVLNARLSEHMGTLQGTFVNFGVGFASMLGVTLAVGAFQLSGISFPAPYLLLGGVFGVLVVLGSNRFIPKIPVVFATALMFVGQIASGLVLDAIRFGTWNWFTLMGGVLVTAGVVLNAFLESREDKSRYPRG